MIQCPHCGKGLLWGVFLDIPPEMKQGLAQWMACEPPEAQEIVTCPSCNQEAGPYGKLFRKDADSRRLEKVQQKTQIMSQVRILEIPSIRLLGYQQMGNYRRDNFLKDIWETFASWLGDLNKTRHFPRSPQFPEISWPENWEMPLALGVRLNPSEETKTSQFCYLTGFPLHERYVEKIKERLTNPEYRNPKGVEIYEVSAGLYACIHFRGESAQFHKIHAFLLKSWLEENQENYILREGPLLEFYFGRLSSWPPKEKDETGHEFNAEMAIPIEIAPVQITSDEENPEELPNPQDGENSSPESRM